MDLSFSIINAWILKIKVKSLDEMPVFYSDLREEPMEILGWLDIKPEEMIYIAIEVLKGYWSFKSMMHASNFYTSKKIQK